MALKPLVGSHIYIYIYIYGVRFVAETTFILALDPTHYLFNGYQVFPLGVRAARE